MSTRTNEALMEYTPFTFPELAADSGFSQEELARDMDGLQVGFQRVKIPGGGSTEFEVPGEEELCCKGGI